MLRFDCCDVCVSGFWEAPSWIPSTPPASEVLHTIRYNFASSGSSAGGYTKRIFMEQELQVLSDLEVELKRRSETVVPVYVSEDEIA